MFYSHSLLSRKGPLGTIWIAAYCFKKLKREQISATNVSSSVDKIMPKVDISHRVLAQLLLGIVKIFSKQVDYLYDDCNQALNQLRKSFSPIKGTIENKVSVRPRTSISGVYEETSNPNYRSPSKKRRTDVSRIETLRASYDEVTIPLPETFDLDSFHFGALNDGDNGKQDQHLMPQDALVDDRRDRTFSNESLPIVVFGVSEYNTTYFSPLADVLPSSIVDVELELSEAGNSSDSTGGQKAVPHSEESEKWNSLTGDISLDVQETLLDRDKQIIVVEKNHMEPVCSSEGKISESGKPDGFGANASTSDKSQLGLKLLETASPKFGLITPAIQERPKSSRKRKRSYDQDIILSNKLMRESLHDASDLVSKRRKCPHTVLDVWKFRKLVNLHQNLMEPLIPSAPSKLVQLPQKKRPKDLSNKSMEGHTCPDKKKGKKLKKSSDTEKEGLKQIANSNGVSPPVCSDLRANSCETLSKENASVDFEFLFEMVELDSHWHIDDQDHGLSVNTRAAAKFLCKRFLELRQKGQEETLGLAQILEGKQRAKCAKFFFEILSLKTSSCINVKQDSPYSDVYIAATPFLESFLGAQA